MPILLIINAFILIACFFLANNKSYKALSASAINPIVFVAFLGLFFMLDFYYFYQIKVIDLFEYSFVISEADIVDGFFIYTCFNFIFFITVMYFSLFYRVKVKPADFFIINKDVAKTCFWTVKLSLVFILVLNFQIFIKMFSGEVTRQVAFSSNQLIHIFFTLILPAFAIYASAHRTEWKKLLLAFIVSAFFIALSGSRGNLLFLLIIVTFVFSFNIKKIHSYFLILAIPVVAFVLLVTRYFFREAWRYNSIFDFIDDKGGVGHVFFSTAEISMAEVLVTINVWKDELIRYPFESFVGGLMFPLPRAIFTFKPTGSGGVLTDLLSPLRWELTRSEIVTTGYGDLIMQFGVLGGLFVFFIMCFIWCKSVFKVLNMSQQSMIFLLPFLLWWPYVFIRADIFNMFGSIWSFCLMYAICIFVKKIKGL